MLETPPSTAFPMHIKQRAEALLAQMTVAEKIGQTCQLASFSEDQYEHLLNAIASGQVGSVINEVDPNKVNQLQKVAVEQSRLGIPLLIGRDVIHGFKTIFPIPLGQAASWDPEIVRQGARIAAIEATQVGINWTFAPMIDISRDPRWGRIAESLGEDPYLCSVLGCAMTEGFQSNDLSGPATLAACAKHFAGYGASESGRDYSTTNIPENELRNVYLEPFRAVANAGVATFMSSFSDLNGVPASGNAWLMDQVLRQEWSYEGFVVSDWESISQLSIHGLSEDDRDSAKQAFNAGVDMEMVSRTYADHLEDLLAQGEVSMAQLDASVSRILELKIALGLFEKPYDHAANFPEKLEQEHLNAAKEAAVKSCVLLRNHNDTLPLQQQNLTDLAVIGPLADDGYEQLGTWIFDGEERHSVTCLQGIKALVGDSLNVHYQRALETSRSVDTSEFESAVKLAKRCDAAVLFLGEESILSGEAHSRAELDLPGAQQALIRAIRETGTPIILVVLAGRPLTLEPIIEDVDALLYAWHPGTMGGPAIAELLFGKRNPSGKLPVTFPRKVGQIPLYYAQKHSGKPATPESYIHMNDIKPRAEQTSLGMAATHLDTHYSALFPFGFGLTYSSVVYDDIQLSKDRISMSESIRISATLKNTGMREVLETAQLYIRDVAGSVTRPVKELKGFKQVKLAPGEAQQVSFDICTKDLAFYDRNMQRNAEPGKFHAWIGSDSDTSLKTEFELYAVRT